MAAGQTKATTATTTAYTITDGAGNSVTLTVNTPNPGAGRSTSFASSGNLQQDGMVLLATLTQELASDVLP
jgi:hypothetical protein